ncbi:MAG: hypothetical protein JWP83_1525 [Mycobacterium sp.]|nr:hypothetical protein [Mycobacterium sp.]
MAPMMLSRRCSRTGQLWPNSVGFTPSSIYLPYIVDTQGDTVTASALSQTARTLQEATVVPATVELATAAAAVAVRLRF